MTLRILVVEDEILIENLPIGLGHQVLDLAMHLSDALEIAHHADLDFAILDVNLDGLRSFPVADILDSGNIPFGFATGYGVSGVEERFKDRPTLSKPFQSQDLERLIAKAIARS